MRPRKENESAHQGRSGSARQGAELNSTWRRSLTGACQALLQLFKTWRFFLKQILDASQYASTNCDRSRHFGHGLTGIFLVFG